MMLDATAGNRMMWPNKNPPNIIFIDREIRLLISPHVFADFRFCPFRKDVFDCIIFDPPHLIKKGGPMPWFSDPSKVGNKWYGNFDNKIECLTSIHKAQKEFNRIGKRLCFKWNESSISLWNILPFFKDWQIIRKKHHKSKYQRGKNPTWWITFIRKEAEAQ